MGWEYKTIKLSASGLLGGVVDTDCLDSMMNDLGRQGWEMVAAFDTNQVYGHTRDVLVIFKRPRR
jgi:hypothetical protein